MQRARVTSRVESDADHRGRRRLLAREGEIVSADEARRRGIPEEVLEPVGPDTRVSTSQVRQIGPTPDTEESEVEENDAEASEETDAGDFPRHLGGPAWELSDGSTVRGKREKAEQAEAALTLPDDQAADDEADSGQES